MSGGFCPMCGVAQVPGVARCSVCGAALGRAAADDPTLVGSSQQLPPATTLPPPPPTGGSTPVGPNAPIAGASLPPPPPPGTYVPGASSPGADPGRSKLVAMIVAGVVLVALVAGLAFAAGRGSSGGDVATSDDSETSTTLEQLTTTSTSTTTSTTTTTTTTTTAPPTTTTTTVAPPPPPPPTTAPVRDVLAEPSGLFCRDLKAKGYSYEEAATYWFAEGSPDRMDADLNGIPCETVYPASEVQAYWNG